MKVLYAILVLSLAAIMVAVGATWWRLRWHLRRPHHAPSHDLESLQPEQPPAQPLEHAEHAASTDNSR
jgi:hypothetical protein